MPPRLDAPQIAALCRLARLELAPGEQQQLVTRLGALLAAFASLGAVDTTAVATAAPAPTAPTDLRPDAVVEALPTATVLQNAARTAGSCFLVPRVVEG